MFMQLSIHIDERHLKEDLELQATRQNRDANRLIRYSDEGLEGGDDQNIELAYDIASLYGGIANWLLQVYCLQSDGMFAMRGRSYYFERE